MSGEVKIITNKAGNTVKITTDKDGNRVAKEYKNNKLVNQTVFHKEQELNWQGELATSIVSGFKDLADMNSTPEETKKDMSGISVFVKK